MTALNTSSASSPPTPFFFNIFHLIILNHCLKKNETRVNLLSLHFCSKPVKSVLLLRHFMVWKMEAQREQVTCLRSLRAQRRQSWGFSPPAHTPHLGALCPCSSSLAFQPSWPRHPYPGLAVLRSLTPASSPCWSSRSRPACSSTWLCYHVIKVGP